VLINTETNTTINQKIKEKSAHLLTCCVIHNSSDDLCGHLRALSSASGTEDRYLTAETGLPA